MDKELSARIDRRAALAKGGGALAALLGGAAWSARSSDAGVGPSRSRVGRRELHPLARADRRALLHREREDSAQHTDGRPGTPLLLRLSVVDASTCKPIKAALVDIWHADAGGVYSGFGSGASSRTFMRGIQRTDATGVATFQTVYPGWYPGRAVHIHVKVHLGGNVVHTGKLFFNDSFTDAVYKRTPYSKRPNRPTRNANDSIYVNGGSKSVLKVQRKGTGYTGAVTMGVHTS
jgi:hypothetical protein